jgi:membrane protein
VRIRSITQALRAAYRDVMRHHDLQVSAALSYFFVLSVFPGLIFLFAVFGSLPLGDLFNHVLLLMSRLLPSETMHVVRSVLSDVLSSHRGRWLSFGMLGTIWVASSGFAALIEALDIAYDAEDDRPYWKTRLISIGLAAITGTLLFVALTTMIVGPRFGDWIASHLGLSSVFAVSWPFLRWGIAIGFTVIAVEVVYFAAPNVKQRFLATLPGAIFAVAAWNFLSFLLGIYFRHFANFNRTYGTLAGLIALMTWLYWTSFALLVGAELNSELAKRSKQGSIESRAAPEMDTATEATVDRAA